MSISKDQLIKVIESLVKENIQYNGDEEPFIYFGEHQIVFSKWKTMDTSMHKLTNLFVQQIFAIVINEAIEDKEKRVLESV